MRNKTGEIIAFMTIIAILVGIIAVLIQIIPAQISGSDTKFGELSSIDDGLKFNYEGKDTKILISSRNSLDIKVNISPYLTSFYNYSGKYKFGFNISIPNNLAGDVIALNLDEIRINFSSEYPLEITNNGVRFYTKSHENDVREYVIYDFSDILENFDVSLTHQRVNNNQIILKFDMSRINFLRGQIVTLDPLISLGNISSASDSYLINLTTEAVYPFTHLFVLNSSVVLYHPFDTENRTNSLNGFTLQDYGRSELDLTMANSSSINDSSCFYGRCLRFSDSSGDYAYRADAGGLDLRNLTISLWINSSGGIPITVGGITGYPIISKGRDPDTASNTINYLLIWNTSNSVEFVFQNSTNSNFTVGIPDILVLGQRYFVSVTHNFTSTCLYLNNTISNCRVGNAFPVTNNVRLGLGTTFNSTSSFFRIGFFNGSIDDLLIMNVPLSSSEISFVYNNQYGKFNSTGQQTFLIQDFAQEGYFNRVNITGTFLQFGGSVLEARLLTWNGSSYNDSIHGFQEKNGSVLIYHFDYEDAFGEKENYTVDYSVYGNNGTNNYTEVDTGRFNLAFKNLGDGFINVQDPDGMLPNNLNYTIALWVKILGNGTSMSSGTPANSSEFAVVADPIIQRGSNAATDMIWFLGYNQSTRRIVFASEGLNTTGGYDKFEALSLSRLNNDTWYHVAVVSSDSSSGSNNLYINNILETTTTGLFPPDTEPSSIMPNIYIGMGSSNRFNPNPVGFCNCMIDELLIFNRTLPAKEIEDIYFAKSYLIRSNTSYVALNNGTLTTTLTINTSVRYGDLQIRYIANNFSYSPFVQDTINLTTWTAATPGGTTCTSNQTNTCLSALNSSCNNRVLYVTADLLSNDTCFTISASNFTLDGNGSSLGYGGILSGVAGIDISADARNVTVKNFRLIWERNIGDTFSNRDGIRITGAGGVSIINNTITVNGTNSEGIRYLSGGNSNRELLIANNTINLIGGTGNAKRGIMISGSSLMSNVSILENNITKRDTGASVVGIYLTSLADYSNLTVDNNTVDMDRSGTALLTTIVRRAKFLNNRFIARNFGLGIQIQSQSNDNMFIGNLINSNIGVAGIYISSGTSINITFFDNNITSYNTDAVDWSAIVFNVTFINGTITTTGSSGAVFDGRNAMTNLKIIGINITAINFSNGITTSSVSTASYNLSIEIINSSFDMFKAGANTTKYATSSDNVLGFINFTNTTWNERTSWVSNLTEFLVNSNWYLDVYVNWSNGTVAPNANVTIMRNDANLIFSGLTGSDGRIGQQTLWQYRFNATNTTEKNLGTRQDWNNYTINVTLRGINQSQSWNMTISRYLTYQFNGSQSFSANIIQGISFSSIMNRISSIFRAIIQLLSPKEIITRVKGIFTSLNQQFNLVANLVRNLFGFRTIIGNVVLTPVVEKSGDFFRALSQGTFLTAVFDKRIGFVRAIFGQFDIDNIIEKKSFFFRIIEALLRIIGIRVGPAEAEPTPTPGAGAGTGGGGGGGGGGVITTIKKFSLDKDKISVTLKQGEVRLVSVEVKNTGSQKLAFNLSSLGLEDLIKISEESFDLTAGESKIIALDFIARENSIPDLYLGKIIARADSIEKEILVSVEIESKRALFDVKVEIPGEFSVVEPGNKLFAEIQIFNLQRIGIVDVAVNYIIKDFEGNVILKEEETLAVETKVSFVKGFIIPYDADDGDYVLYVRARYEDSVASASAFFKVGKIIFLSPERVITYSVLIFALTLIMLIIYFIIKARIRVIEKRDIITKIKRYYRK